MKPNEIQKQICNIIRSHIGYWEHTNDITSPTHTSDIEEDCLLLEDIISNEKLIALENILKELYWFIRKFDNK